MPIKQVFLGLAKMSCEFENDVPLQSTDDGFL